MIRCEQSAGKFRLKFLALHEPVGYRAQILGHHDIWTADGKIAELAPIAINGEVQELELCEHEVAWLKGLPGRDYRGNYDFQLEKLS